MTWYSVCTIDRLPADRGVAALVDGRQLALFRLHGAERIHAVANVDPFSGVGCLSRGIVGDVDGEPMVAAPVYKQRFSLATGRCFDDPTVTIDVFDVRLRDDWVEVRVP
jgi:nitrite reductase (NADH) small subunit